MCVASEQFLEIIDTKGQVELKKWLQIISRKWYELLSISVHRGVVGQLHAASVAGWQHAY